MDVVQEVFNQINGIFAIVKEFLENLIADIKGLFGGNEDTEA